VTGSNINLKNLEKAATPSGQSWNRLSASQKKGYAGYLGQSGQSIDDSIQSMVNMLPGNIRLGRTWANA
jgi:hypothetical protein